jgi:hypothetical protein
MRARCAEALTSGWGSVSAWESAGTAAGSPIRPSAAAASRRIRADCRGVWRAGRIVNLRIETTIADTGGSVKA